MRMHFMLYNYNLKCFFPIVSQPTLINLHLIKWKDKHGKIHRLKIVEKTGSKWHKIGILTNQSTEKLDNYREMMLNDQIKCCECVFDEWIKNNTSPYRVTWEGLYELLMDVDLAEVQRELRETIERAYE